jgi:hypothetical protein
MLQRGAESARLSLVSVMPEAIADETGWGSMSLKNSHGQENGHGRHDITALRFVEDTLSGEEVQALVAYHLADMQRHSPACRSTPCRWRRCASRTSPSGRHGSGSHRRHLRPAAPVGRSWRAEIDARRPGMARARRGRGDAGCISCPRPGAGVTPGSASKPGAPNRSTRRSGSTASMASCPAPPLPIT